MKIKNKIKELISTFGSKDLAIKVVDEILNMAKERGPKEFPHMYISNDAEDFYKEIKHELEKL